MPGFPRQARTDQRESADRIDPALAAEATESTDAAEKTEPIDKIEPAEPTDKMDPAEPIDKMDPLEPIDKIDPLEPMLRMDPSLFRMESFSQGPRHQGESQPCRYPAARLGSPNGTKSQLTPDSVLRQRRCEAQTESLG